MDSAHPGLGIGGPRSSAGGLCGDQPERPQRLQAGWNEDCLPGFRLLAAYGPEKVTMPGQHEQTTASYRDFLRRKWRLLLLVLLTLAAAELVAVRLWDEFHPVQPRYLDRSPPPITKAQKQSAVDLVRESGTVERINSGQAWDITEVIDLPGTRTVNVYVEWDEPVASNGPWLTNGAPKWLGRNCRNVRSRFHLPISNVRFLRLSVSLEGMEIVRLWPKSPPQLMEQYLDDRPAVGQGNFLGRYEIYNEKAGRSVYSGPMILSAFVPGTCPRGERYD